MTIAQEITMMLMLLVTSKGMAGVPRASLGGDCGNVECV
jgi:Na+/H+-dicarboxylate symporter